MLVMRINRFGKSLIQIRHQPHTERIPDHKQRLFHRRLRIFINQHKAVVFVFQTLNRHTIQKTDPVIGIFNPRYVQIGFLTAGNADHFRPERRYRQMVAEFVQIISHSAVTDITAHFIPMRVQRKINFHRHFLFRRRQGFFKIENFNLGVFLQIFHRQIHARLLRFPLFLQPLRHIFRIHCFFVRRNDNHIVDAAPGIKLPGLFHSRCHLPELVFAEAYLSEIINQRITVRHFGGIIKSPAFLPLNGYSVVNAQLILDFAVFFQQFLPSGKSIVIISFKLFGKIPGQFRRFSFQRAVVQQLRITGHQIRQKRIKDNIQKHHCRKQAIPDIKFLQPFSNHHNVPRKFARN